jgi:hypothetical protein
MNDLTIKRKTVGSGGPFGSLQSFGSGSPGLALGDWQTDATATPILMVARVTEAVLCGIGVTAAWTASILCGGVLFQGPAFFIELLATLVS